MKAKIVIINKKNFLISTLSIILIIFLLIGLKFICINTIKYYDPIYKGNENIKSVAFACNVVWGNEYLPQILKILKDNNIKITFFIGGKWAKDYPKLLMDIYNDQHELGNHGYRHLEQSKLDIENNRKEISMSEEIIENITGYKTNLFAPPYGDMNKIVVEAAEELGYKVIMWSIDTIDWKTKDYNKIVERIEKKHHPGAIVLMHPTQSTVNALPIMIKSLKEKGYSIVPVSKLLD